MRPEMWLSSAGVGLAVRRSKSLRLQWRLLGDNEEQNYLLSPSVLYAHDAQGYRSAAFPIFYGSILVCLLSVRFAVLAAALE